MPEYLAPGVFVEEVSFRPSQILPASTSVDFEFFIINLSLLGSLKRFNVLDASFIT